jgi:hypothetical protein
MSLQTSLPTYLSRKRNLDGAHEPTTTEPEPKRSKLEDLEKSAQDLRNQIHYHLHEWVQLKFEERLLRQEKDPILAQIREEKRLLKQQLTEVLVQENALSLQVTVPCKIGPKAVPEEEAGTWYIRYEGHNSYKSITPDLVASLIRKMFSRRYLSDLRNQEVARKVIMQGEQQRSNLLWTKLQKAVNCGALCAWLTEVFTHLLREQVVTRQEVPTVKRSRMRVPRDAEKTNLAVNRVSINPYHISLVRRYVQQSLENKKLYQQRIARVNDVQRAIEQHERTLLPLLESTGFTQQALQVNCNKETFGYLIVLYEDHARTKELLPLEPLSGEENETKSPRLPGIKKTQECCSAAFPKLMRSILPTNDISWITLINWLNEVDEAKHQEFVNDVIQTITSDLFADAPGPKAEEPSNDPGKGQSTLKERNAPPSLKKLMIVPHSRNSSFQ